MISKTVNTERRSSVLRHIDDRKRFLKLTCRRRGEVNPDFIVRWPVDSVSDASARGIFNYGSSSRIS